MKGSVGQYTANVSVSTAEDGLIGIDVRATDVTGKSSVKSVAVQKDTTPPTVEVVLPGGDDIVNGENLIAFIAKDNGRLDKVQYFAPLKKGETPKAVDIPLASMITTHIGTAEKPIDDLMSFKFIDAIGNETEAKSSSGISSSTM